MKKHVAIIFGLGLLLLSSVSAKADSSFSKDLYFGMQKDSEVTKLQEFLSSEGLYSGPITGNYFSLTMKAVVAFQKREGVNSSGYFGPKSRAKADVILGSQIQASEAQAVAETGSTTTPPIPPKTTNDVANTLQSQLDALLKQVGLLQDQLKAQQQTQTSIQTLQTQVAQQGQTLQQIQQNTAPTPTPAPIIDATPKLDFNRQSPTSFFLESTGQSFSWTSSNVTNCTASGDWNGSRPVSGTEQLSLTKTGSYTYTLTCSDSSGGQISRTLNVTAISMAVKITSLKINGVENTGQTFNFKKGDSFTINWTLQQSMEYPSCSINGNVNKVGGFSGSKIVDLVFMDALTDQTHWAVPAIGTTTISFSCIGNYTSGVDSKTINLLISQ